MSDFPWETDRLASTPYDSIEGQIPPTEPVSEEIQALPQIEAKAPVPEVATESEMPWDQDALASTPLDTLDPPVQEATGQNFFERVGEDLTERKRQMAETTAQQQAGELPAREAILQRSGAMAGGVFDVLGEGFISGASGLSYITPDVIEDPIKEKLSEAWDAFVKTPVGQAGMTALATSAEMYGMWKKNNPRAAKNIESVINVGLLFAPVGSKARKNAPPTRLGRASTSVDQTAERQRRVKRFDKIKGLIMEKETPTVRREQAMRITEEGLLKKQVVQPTNFETEMIAEVSKIPKVGKVYKSLQGNLNEIKNANNKISENLYNAIKKEDTSIPYQISTKRIDDVADELEHFDPQITGSSALTASRVADQALLEVGRRPPTASGMLKARQAFDDWVELKKGKGFLGGDKQTAMLEGVKAIRDEMNEMIAVNLKSASARTEWRRNTLLYQSMKRLQPKAAAEYNSIVGRLFQNTVKIIAPRNEILQVLGGISAMGGLGAAAYWAGYLREAAIIGAVAYGGTKLVTSVAVKKGTAKLLKWADRAILTSENPSMIKQLRADRAALLEIMDSIEVIPEETQ